MAFTGAPVLVKITDQLFRITGVSLAAAATGTIALAQNAAAAEVDITAPDWGAYEVPGAHGGTVTLNESVSVQVVKAAAGLATTEAVACVKTGTLPADFLITLSNPDAADSGALEIYVRFK